jgi:hypothetical protein
MQTDNTEQDGKNNHALVSRLITAHFDRPNVGIFEQ